MEEVHAFCAAHQDVADPRNDEGRDIICHAVLDDDVAVVAVDAGEEDNFHAVQDGQVLHALLCAAVADDAEFLGKAVQVDEVRHAPSHIPDDIGLLRLKMLKIPVMRAFAPEDRDRDLHCQDQEIRRDRGQMLLQEPVDDEEDHVRFQKGQDLAVDHL